MKKIQINLGHMILVIALLFGGGLIISDSLATYYPSGTGAVINATNMTWTGLYDYPAACPGSSAITGLGDAVTCSDLWVDEAGDDMSGNLSIPYPYFLNADNIAVRFLNPRNFSYINVTSNMSVSGNLSSEWILVKSVNASEPSYFNDITIADKITFGLGEFIDNLINGWLNMTASLLVDGDLNVSHSYRINADNIAVNYVRPLDFDFVNITSNLTVEGNVSSDWLYVNRLNTTGDAVIGGNLTLTDKIVFRFNEMIDNLKDGWLQITGSLNVTQNITTGKGMTISSDNIALNTLRPWTANFINITSNTTVNGNLTVTEFMSASNIAVNSIQGLDGDAITFIDNATFETNVSAKRLFVSNVVLETSLSDEANDGIVNVSYLLTEHLRVRNESSSTIFEVNDSTAEYTSNQNQTLTFNIVTNENSGSAALSQWSISNDVGKELSCSITSSDFDYDGMSLSNFTFCSASEDFYIGTWDNDVDLWKLNNYSIETVIDNGYWWNDSSGNGLGHLDGSGNLDIAGNFTGTQIYGEMYNYSSNASAWDFDIDAASVYYNVSGLQVGDLNGFTFTSSAVAAGGSYLTAKIAGLYHIMASFSFEASENNALYGVGVAKNGDISLSRDCYSRRFGVKNQAASVSMSCFLDLSVDDTINLQVENEETNRDIRVHTANVNAKRVGG